MYIYIHGFRTKYMFVYIQRYCSREVQIKVISSYSCNHIYLYEYIYINVYIYMYILTCIYKLLYNYIYMYIYILYTYIYTYTGTAEVQRSMYMLTCIYTWIYNYIYIHICIHIYIYYIYIYIYIHIQVLQRCRDQGHPVVQLHQWCVPHAPPRTSHARQCVSPAD